MGDARVLDGKWLAKLVQADITRRIAELRAQGKRAAGLGVILVGDNPASKVYVSNKEKTAKNCGLETFNTHLPASASFEDISRTIKQYNDSDVVDGILLQLPLPAHLDSNKVLDLIDPAKDADGLHPVNQGLLLRGGGKLRSCTPLGAMKLIDLALSTVAIGADNVQISDIPEQSLAGKRAVVLGRSILVGKPVALMLLERNATVTIAHSKTKDLPDLVRTADILVAAIGSADFVKADWIKEGATVIDVGINRLANGSLRGDVDYEAALRRCAAITPVPGGVGPMTVTMLIHNTVLCYQGS